MKRKNYASIWVIVLIAIYVAFRIFGHAQRDRVVISNKQSSTLNRSGHLILTKHAKCRMQCRDITFDEIGEIVKDGNINANKSELDTDHPKYALEGYSHDHQHIRVIIAPEEQNLVVVTCIDLENEHSCDCE